MCSLSLITFLFLFPLYLCNPLTPSVHQIGIWEPCSTTPGTCIDTSSYSCTTSTLTGLCPGPVNVRCCPSPGGISFGSCASIGVCTRTSLCSTTTKTGLCPGPSGIKCCPFKKAPNIPPRKVIEDKPSGRDCSFYENIEKRGNKICTDKCRTFEIKDGYTESYLGNAFCACDVTPKNQLSARTVRSCLQRRLIDASRRGKTMWTRREVRFLLIRVHIGWYFVFVDTVKRNIVVY